MILLASVTSFPGNKRFNIKANVEFRALNHAKSNPEKGYPNFGTNPELLVVCP